MTIRLFCAMSVLPLLAGACALGSPDAVDNSEESTAATQQNLLGNVSQTDTHDFANAVVWITFQNSSNVTNARCSGTLVKPNKVLTAAHCLPSAYDHGWVQFPNPDGTLISEHHDFQSVWIAPGGIIDAPALSPDRDIAVITLDNAVDNITPVPIFLGDPEINFGTRLNKKYWSIGFGQIEALEVTSHGTGAGIRRSGELSQLRAERDPCTLWEADCWETVVWSSKPIREGNTLEASLGDSGGPLLFNVDTGNAVMSGVFSNIDNNDDSYNRWATLGINAEFLWEKLELAYTKSLADQRAGTAIYAKHSANINDRAHVIFPNGSGARVVAGDGPVRVGVDAVVGDVLSRGPISLSDRSSSNSVASSNRISSASTAKSTSSLQGEFQKFEDFSITSPYPSTGSGQTIIQPNSVVSLMPHSYGSYIVNAGSTLTLQSGLYVFNNLQLESGSTLVLGNGPTWVFVTTSSSVIFRGKVLGSAGNSLIAVTNSTDVVLGSAWSATLVAPKASVVADMEGTTALVGSFFVNNFDLHQGKYLKFAPFTHNWIPTCTGMGGYFTCN